MIIKAECSLHFLLFGTKWLSFREMRKALNIYFTKNWLKSYLLIDNMGKKEWVEAYYK